ncbi:hypothetical protein [Geminocystis sp. NIES-3708]|uniref:hypothetical protein n=1 Tax=Geminocystis sp. NIES-3708 TaxID=1615909 RepID=UPI00130D5BC7|nr:hypothetical protein [Geminocystis sp. NIES-3708]
MLQVFNFFSLPDEAKPLLIRAEKITFRGNRDDYWKWELNKKTVEEYKYVLRSE